MSVHDHLRGLWQRHGDRIFAEPAGFRDALAAGVPAQLLTSQDAELLVQVISTGTLRGLIDERGRGVPADQVLNRASAHLAQAAQVSPDRARWATAVMGYAVDRWGADQVPPAGSALPSAGLPNPGLADPGLPDPGLTRRPPPAPMPPANPRPPVSSVPPPFPVATTPTNPPPRRTGLVIGAIVGALVLIAAVVGAFVLLSGDDKDDPRADDPETSPASSETTGLSLEFDAIQSRYSPLGVSLLDSMEQCEQAPMESGQTERLVCTSPDAELELASYTSESATIAKQRSVVTYAPGSLFSNQQTGVVYAEGGEDGAATLYWDDRGRKRTAQLTAVSESVSLDQLQRLFEDAGSVLDFPTEVEDEGLSTFIAEFVSVEQCDRVPTSYPGMLETVECANSEGDKVYFSKAAGPRPFRDYRASAVAKGEEQGNSPEGWRFGEGRREGILVDTTSDGAAVRYWDQRTCLCYAEAFRLDGNADALERWWQQA